jgi:hypothetical protein
VPLLEKSEKFRNRYTKVISFPKFNKNEIENDIEEINVENTNTKESQDNDKEKVNIIEDDDVPNIFI